MSDSRARILSSIRQSLQTAHLPSPPAVDLPAPLDERPASALAEQFAAELRALSGTFLTAAAVDLPDLVARLTRERGSERLLAWESEQLPAPGLVAALRQAGLRVANGAVPAGPERTTTLAEWETITVGLTGADAAIAETGTLVLLAGAGRPRLAAMSVRRHIVLITPAQLFPTLAAWQASRPDLARELRARSAALLVTGPSRTADIEMTLTVGVHGPGELIVVLVTA